MISVIVPVYKVEPYLNKCVQSIVDQTYRDLEIILVDDGSPDRCGQMCDAWAEKDSRIRVIHTKNQGSSAARNVALDLAQGDFIAFVDSDDYISADMLSHLISLMHEDIDIAECAYTLTENNDAEFNLQIDAAKEYDASMAMSAHIQNHAFQQVIWNKLYRRSTIGEIRFPVGKKVDDEFFTYQVLGRANKLIRSERICYAYRQQSASIMHTIPVYHWFAGVEAKVLRHEYILSHFPELSALSHKSVIGSCLYLNQLAMRVADKQTQNKIREATADIFAKYPLTADSLHAMTAKERFWLGMACKSMPLACSLRNLLKIGL